MLPCPRFEDIFRAVKDGTAAGEIRMLIAESTAQVAAGCGQIRNGLNQPVVIARRGIRL